MKMRKWVAAKWGGCMVKRTWVLLGVLLWAGAIDAQDAPAPLPLPDELKQQVDSGEYRDALKGLTRVLDLKGAAAEPYNRFEMLALRAECQLQLRQTAAALDSLTAAQKEAASQGNADDVGASLAFADLIQRSPALRYTPKTSNGPLAKKPIDILGRGQRPDAYKALFADELTSAQQKVRQAETARQMPPILDAAKNAAALRGIEKAGTGDDVQTQALTKGLSARGLSLMTSALGDLSVRIDAVSKIANTTVTTSVMQYDQISGRSWPQQILTRRGLDGGNMSELKGIQQTCAQITSAANDLGLALSQDQNAYKDIAAQADGARNKAGALLTENFNAPIQ